MRSCNTLGILAHVLSQPLVPANPESAKKCLTQLADISSMAKVSKWLLHCLLFTVVASSLVVEGRQRQENEMHGMIWHAKLCLHPGPSWH